MVHIDDYLSYECAIEDMLYRDLENGYQIYIGDSYSFEHIKNLILKLPIQEIEEIYKLGNPEVEDWEPEKRSITFRDVMLGVAGVGLTVLMIICVGSLSYFLVSWINLDFAPVAALFAATLFGFSIGRERPVETIVGLFILGLPAFLFFTIFPCPKSFEMSSSNFFLGATAGVILGWCIARFFKFILVFFEGGKGG